MRFAIKVIWDDGEEEFLKNGQTNVPTPFTSRQEAEKQVEFMRMGFDEGECQSINIVPYPPKGSTQAHDRE